MNILSIGGDKNALVVGSDTHARMEMLRTHVSALDIFVWPQIHSWRTVLGAARARAYDVVMAQDPFWRGALAWFVAHRQRLRLNLQVHTDLQAQPLRRRALARLLLRRADSVRVVSEKVRAQVQATGTKARVHVLPVFVDLARFQNLERTSHDRPTILWVGRFEQEKDPRYAIEVLKQVRAEGVDAKLVMLGAGRLESALKQAARGLPVEFPGWKAPEEYLKVADVVLSTSLHESWGASMVEALAAGVPVVAPDVGIAREAGAIITKRPDMAATVSRVLADKTPGTLRIGFLTKEEWLKRWKETLV